MIGTNNMGWSDTRVEDIAQGVEVIVNELVTKMPATKLILLGILPKADRFCAKVRQVNEVIARLNNDKNIYFLDMWSAYVHRDGKQNTDLYLDDRLHINWKGYEVWYKTMEPLLKILVPEF
ncbi:unnamed protein product [Oppiella nova]|uniref:SGNH hydrolase-type esterase domain-containing protein n=1 Tax=Oppiella nova TaxID=334625 RepID=A0A7R9R0C3_9ACAR|nr:unnamed protein product [Oppiella nova]CAG2181287.1 unnamed protein product [Oppiella nova]